MNHGTGFLLAGCFAIALGGCQVVSGLSGVDLDGNGGGGGPTNICQQADQKISQCAGALGSITVPKACTSTRDKCQAGCVEAATCFDIKQSAKSLNACVTGCR